MGSSSRSGKEDENEGLPVCQRLLGRAREIGIGKVQLTKDKGVKRRKKTSFVRVVGRVAGGESDTFGGKEGKRRERGRHLWADPRVPDEGKEDVVSGGFNQSAFEVKDTEEELFSWGGGST